jgi:predicted MFS family arabinose efflux permease
MSNTVPAPTTAEMDQRVAGPSNAIVLLLAVGCGLSIANIYYAQPLLGLIAPAVGIGYGSASVIVTLTQLGFAAGLLLLVPLGDLVENRRLVVTTVVASIPALLLAAFAHSAVVFLVAVALIGMASVAVQMLVPLAAHLAPDHIRGQVIGNVMSGLLVGILLARPAASLITSLFGWRAVFIGSALIMASLALLLRVALPRRQPAADHHYGELLVSLLALPVKMPPLRRRIVYQTACFAAFTLFWTTVPLLLLKDFGFTQRGVALFALFGAAGALIAPVAGRLADRNFTRIGTVTSLLAIVLSFAIAWAGAAVHSVVILGAAGVILDSAVQANQVFSQRIIFSLAPHLRSRLNGAFMSTFFTGSALISLVASPILVDDGWFGICLTGAVLPLLALGYFMLRDR